MDSQSCKLVNYAHFEEPRTNVEPIINFAVLYACMPARDGELENFKRCLKRANPLPVYEFPCIYVKLMTRILERHLNLLVRCYTSCLVSLSARVSNSKNSEDN